jgi:gliding motility-associated-like protein
LTLLPDGVKRDTIDVSICDGESVTIDGAAYSQSGLYSDTISTIGCDSIHTIRVTVLSNPDPQITASSTEVKQGDTVQLTISGTALQNYYWTSSAVISDAHSQNPTAIINQSAWIIVQTVDANNCSATDSILIQLAECDGSIFVPNAFTPNGDGRNDLYRVFARCAELNSLQIYNRWGEKVWETEDINQGWDGTYRGSAQPTEVYVYLISYRLLSDKSGVSKHKQGSITLIR